MDSYIYTYSFTTIQATELYGMMLRGNFGSIYRGVKK